MSNRMQRKGTRRVLSVLPPEGIDLAREMDRYRSWMTDQALVQARGEMTEAARLLGMRPEALAALTEPRSGTHERIAVNDAGRATRRELAVAKANAGRLAPLAKCGRKA